MADEEEIAPICIITSNGMVCMESPLKLVLRKKRGEEEAFKATWREHSWHDRDALVERIQQDLVVPSQKDEDSPPRVSAKKRRQIARIAVFLEQAAAFLDEHDESLDLRTRWTIVKRD